MGVGSVSLGLALIDFQFAVGFSGAPYSSCGILFQNTGASIIKLGARNNLNTCIYVSNEPITLSGGWNIKVNGATNLGSWGSEYDISEYKYVAIYWSQDSSQYGSNGGFPGIQGNVVIN